MQTSASCLHPANRLSGSVWSCRAHKRHHPQHRDIGSLALAASPKQAKEDRWRNPDQLKAINRNERAQHCVAALKDAEHPEIDEPEKFGAGNILKGTRSQFGAKRGGKKRRLS